MKSKNKVSLKKPTTLEAISSFIENTKNGDYSDKSPEILNISFGRSDDNENVQTILQQNSNHDILLFGLSF